MDSRNHARSQMVNNFSDVAKAILKQQDIFLMNQPVSGQKFIYWCCKTVKVEEHKS